MLYFFTPIEKTKNLLFNGAKAVMGKIWTGEDKCTTNNPSVPEDTPTNSQTLLKGQTLIGQDGRLTKGASAKGESGCVRIHPLAPNPSTSSVSLYSALD